MMALCWYFDRIVASRYCFFSYWLSIHSFDACLFPRHSLFAYEFRIQVHLYCHSLSALCDYWSLFSSRSLCQLLTLSLMQLNLKIILSTFIRFLLHWMITYRRVIVSTKIQEREFSRFSFLRLLHLFHLPHHIWINQMMFICQRYCVKQWKETVRFNLFMVH